MISEQRPPSADDQPAPPRYVLVVRVPRELEVRIEDTFLTMSGLTKPAMGYHITVLGPFHLADGRTANDLSTVAAACRRHAPFTVRLRGWDVFQEQGENVPYLRVTSPEPLAALHRELLAAVEDVVRFQNERVREWNLVRYRPHVTLALGLSDAKLADFRSLAERRAFTSEFTAGGVWLLEQARYHPWQSLAEYPLGARKD